MGGNFGAHLLLSHHINADISKWTVYATSSGRLANAIWIVGALSYVPRFLFVPES
jgi:hypothetical protein